MKRSLLTFLILFCSATSYGDLICSDSEGPFARNVDARIEVNGRVLKRMTTDGTGCVETPEASGIYKQAVLYVRYRRGGYRGISLANGTATRDSSVNREVSVVAPVTGSQADPNFQRTQDDTGKEITASTRLNICTITTGMNRTSARISNLWGFLPTNSATRTSEAAARQLERDCAKMTWSPESLQDKDLPRIENSSGVFMKVTKAR